MTKQIRGVRSAPAVADILSDPLTRGGDIFRAWRPHRLRCKPIGHVDADKAVLHSPKHDVVKKWGTAFAFVAGHEGAAVNKHQHRAWRRRRLRPEDIEQIAIVRAVFDVTLDPDALIGLFFLQWRCDFRSYRIIHDEAG